MALHPIRALDCVVEEFKDYLRTEFRAKDPGLRASLETELDRAGFLAQEPFFQAHRPFKSGKKWRDLPLDGRLAQVMVDRARRFGSETPEHAFLHQSEAVGHLLSSEAGPTVVTTGTGSGKTECFLLPVIQNAIQDAAQFSRSGLTAILVYPMNALANDQMERIDAYLTASGFSGTVRVEKYDRGTDQATRESMRKNPPHILLTNYMMLEYLLVRPADREGIFANHRCRYLVLDEVHTYRGTLGANIALLVRRLKAHLAQARQDWATDIPPEKQLMRHPKLTPVGTSATIKSVREVEHVSAEEMRQLRNEAVQEFFGKLMGVERASIHVYGEEVQELHVPEGARYPAEIAPVSEVDCDDPESVRLALCRVAGISEAASLEEAVQSCRLLWDLDRWLISSPMPVPEIVDRLIREVPERKNCSREEIRGEVETVLALGAALPEGTKGGLRLRAHRFIRGGWAFHRCVNPDCGKLYPMGGGPCSACGHVTAPLYLCRSCGADFLRFVALGDQNPDVAPLLPGEDEREKDDKKEWLLYEPGRFNSMVGDEEPEEPDEEDAFRPSARGTRPQPTQIRNRPVLDGSFDPASLRFSLNPDAYTMKVTLTPARTRCLCCGATAGSRNILTRVALGTSAAVKVLGEGLVEALESSNQHTAGHDGKQRLLVFSDSRQDAAHQARFVIYASRYDRMRRRLVNLLRERGPMTLQDTVVHLGAAAVTERDNPHVPEEANWIPDEEQDRIRAWEEAPLLDDLAITAGYRATAVNLGLVAVQYHRLDEYVQSQGTNLASELGLSAEQLEYLCQCLLDEMRIRGALSRDMLRFHPSSTKCPAFVRAAQWERRIKSPRGYSCDKQGEPIAHLDTSEVPMGVSVTNLWRSGSGRGRSPRLQRLMEHLFTRWGTVEAQSDMLMAVMTFLKRGRFVIPADLSGFKESKKLLQVNADCVRLLFVEEKARFHCDVCDLAKPGSLPNMPCPRCHGLLKPWSDQEVTQNRSVRRIFSDKVIPLYAGEHTAQVTNQNRLTLEANFKAPNNVSKVNFVACSPTLEMGIDVGGLDAVILRNVPPRPDNYAQRGGRAGRRSRVGLVLGYARSTPHDMYFFDKPAEMISGEVPAPALSLENRDVILRHVNAIAFGAAEPGLAGRMVEYVSPMGTVEQEKVDALKAAVSAQFEHAVELARGAFGESVLIGDVDLLRVELSGLTDRIQDVIDRTAYQVQRLRQAVDNFATTLQGASASACASDLVARLLGIQTERTRQQSEADDRSAGYPLRRFAEFGILPGYEFPTEPASLRLLGDGSEEEPITVERRFGIGQFQPEAQVYARTLRWRVIGLDTSSPWNPRTEGADWVYRKCKTCGLRFSADTPRCPRCQEERLDQDLPAGAFGGFLGRRDETTVLDEEERFAARNLVIPYPQWDGDIVARWSVGPGWGLRLNRREVVWWLNEGRPPTAADLKENKLLLHQEARGYMLCSSCGRMLTLPEEPNSGKTKGGRTKTKSPERNRDAFGHTPDCPQTGKSPRPMAIGTSKPVETLRLLLPVPAQETDLGIESFGITLGYSLLVGMRKLYMLDGPEIQFVLEGPWKSGSESAECRLIGLTFIDTSLGGTGYLERVGNELNLAASRSIEHLDHPDCDTACYRCLKAYDNQRYHEKLRWPMVMPHLEALAAAPPSARPLETGDIEDPRPWLEAYAAGVGSPLELAFLRLFEKHGFTPEKQVHVSPDSGGAAISIADFAVPEKHVAIYIDGAAFHVGHNLRRDRYIRGRLRNGIPPWTVFELTAADLRRGEALVRELKTAGAS